MAKNANAKRLALVHFDAAQYKTIAERYAGGRGIEGKVRRHHRGRGRQGNNHVTSPPISNYFCPMINRWVRAQKRSALINCPRSSVRRTCPPGARTSTPTVSIRPSIIPTRRWWSVPGRPGRCPPIVRAALEHRVPITARGGGTGLCGGAVPLFGGIVLQTDQDEPDQGDEGRGPLLRGGGRGRLRQTERGAGAEEVLLPDRSGQWGGLHHRGNGGD